MIMSFLTLLVPTSAQTGFYAEFRHEFSKIDGLGYSNYRITAMGKFCVLKNSDYEISGIGYFRQTDRESWSAAPSEALGGVEFALNYAALQFLAGVNSVKFEGKKGRGRVALLIGKMSPKKTFFETYLYGAIEAGGPTGWYVEGRMHSALTEWMSLGFVIDRNEQDNETSDTGYGVRTDITLPQTPINIFGEMKWRWGESERRNKIIGVVGTRLTF